MQQRLEHVRLLGRTAWIGDLDPLAVTGSRPCVVDRSDVLGTERRRDRSGIDIGYRGRFGLLWGNLPVGLGLFVLSPPAVEAILDAVGEVFELGDALRSDHGSKTVREERTEPWDLVDGEPQGEDRHRSSHAEADEPALEPALPSFLGLRVAHEARIVPRLSQERSFVARPREFLGGRAWV